MSLFKITTTTLFAMTMASMLYTSSAFVAGPPTRTAAATTTTKETTRLYLEDRIADMIDNEVYRQHHKKDFENQWMEKNREAIFHRLRDSNTMMQVEDPEDFRQLAKDRKMARDDPARYCADRCITTGNCDVYEDFFHFSPEQVMEFCSDCVLSDGEEPCEIPENFYELDKLRP